MAYWACSIFDSFTQDACTRWYPFHLTKYSHYHPLSCFDLTMVSISNFGLLSMNSGGGPELCSILGLEASWLTDLKNKTWNMGWIVRFSSNSNLYMSNFFFPTFWVDLHMDPRTCGSNFLAIEIFLCSTTLHLLPQNSPLIGTWDLSTKSLYCLCTF